ncbi:hypothetical protein [Roseateles sp.]|uniref:hypothetical protein n=1 Tax=Roseateles sp. TaxID=1971397 RepID=UPI0039E8FBC4
MAFNTIQFQHGMSVPEFIERFGTEEQCAEAVKAMALHTTRSEAVVAHEAHA